MRIRPVDRVVLLNIKTKGLDFKKIREEQDDYDEELESFEGSSEASDDLEDGDYDVLQTSRRRSSRIVKQTTSKQRKLPFSPKKTRSKRYYVSDSGSESEGAKRRSSRFREKKNYTVDEGSDFEDPDSSEFDGSPGPSRKRPRILLRKGPKPAYGLIRNIDDYYEPDPLTAALRAHRENCERCHREPAHILLKKPIRKKKKRKNDDDLEENDEETFTRLGGWVRW